MIRLRPSWSIAVLCSLLACDSGEKPAPKKGDAKKGDAKKGDAKKGEAKKVEAKKDEPAKPAEKHFDVTQDKSGILARSAAALETDEAIDGEDLRELSHHAEKLTSVEDVCRHIAEVRKTGDDIKACVKENEHHIVQIGPEIYAQLAACDMAAKTPEELDACDAAEKEAERKLHEKPHGDGLSKETCGEFFTHFEKLAMEDAADHAELVEEILEEVKPDVLVACAEQGTKAEVDCALKAKTMHDLRECASKLL